MSSQKHKGDHGQRQARRDAARKEITPAMAGKPRRVFLRNSLYIWGTIGVIAAVIALLIGFELLGLWDNVIGSILSVLVGAFGCMCIYDLALLFTACISFGEGMVNAGKNPQGQPMIFHAASVSRLEMRDAEDKPLPEDAPLYKHAPLVCVLESGRVTRRSVSRLTQKQYGKIKEALAAEKKFKEAP